VKSEIVILEGDSVTCDLATFDGIDVQIVDPPYSARVHKQMVSTGSNGAGPTARDVGFEALSAELKYRIYAVAKRVKRWSAVFTDAESVGQWYADTSFWPKEIEYIRSLPWVRWSQPQISGDRPCSGREEICLFHPPGAKRWNGPGGLTCFEEDALPIRFVAKSLRGADKHPTEKPLDLALALVSALSDPGESVVDICAGGGTTALACAILGRDCLCVERDPRWVAYGQKRIDAFALGQLSDRDRERLDRWCEATHTEAAATPVPKAKDGSDVKTYERAQRRIADVERGAEWL
jgi:hypothetical protein